MGNQTNVLDRLHKFLSVALKVEASHEVSAYLVLQDVRGFDSAVELDNLLSDYITAIRSHEHKVRSMQTVHSEQYRNLHLDYITQIKVGLLTIRSMNWRQFQSTFNRDFLNMILSLSAGTSTHQEEEPIAADALGSLHIEISEHIEEVMATDVEDELKQALIIGLESIRQSILQYDIFGAEGIIGAVDTNVGIWLRYKSYLEDIPQNDRETFASIQAWVIKLNNIALASLKYLPSAIKSTQLMIGDGE